ncbi:MAG: hypothetical protein ACTIM4_03790 [Marinomonas sp.]
MSKQQSPFRAPRKELINLIQKGVFSLLLLLIISAIGLYKFIDLELGDRAVKQSSLMMLIEHTHAAELYWYELLLQQQTDTHSSTSSMIQDPLLLHSKLSEIYTQIDLKLAQYKSVDSTSRLHFLTVKDELSFLNVMGTDPIKWSTLSQQDRNVIYGFIEKAKEQNSQFSERVGILSYRNQMMIGFAEWAPFSVFGLVALVLIVFSVVLVRRLTGGFQHLHIVLEKHKQGHFTLDSEYQLVDEFTDLGHLLDNELSSREFELSEVLNDISLMESGLSKLDSAFLVADEHGDVKWMSRGFTDLWKVNNSIFEPLFNIDPGIDSPLGERLPDVLLNTDSDIKLSLSNGRYALNLELLRDADPTSMLLQLMPLSQLAEITVLEKSLELMVQGSWQYPIKVLRDDSPFKDFAVLLEEVRVGVESIINTVSALDSREKTDTQITKLQQINTRLVLEFSDNHANIKPLFPVIASLPEVDIELNDMALLSEKISDTVLVGYESLLQQLVLVEKDILGNTLLLKDVDRCLNDVLMAVHSSLSSAQGQSSQVRHNFSVDLDHDIDCVKKQIASMLEMVSLTHTLIESGHSVGAVRLVRAKALIDELEGRVSNVLALTASQNSTEMEDMMLLQKGSDKLDEV